MTIYTNNESETEALGEKLAGYLKPGAVVAFYGELGAGKTAFVRGMARGLGIDGRITSPTYTIVNEYSGDAVLYHFDMYRISGPEELYSIGWYDYLEGDGICAVEWSENIIGAFNGGEISVKIEMLSETGRGITIEGITDADFSF